MFLKVGHLNSIIMANNIFWIRVARSVIVLFGYVVVGILAYLPVGSMSNDPTFLLIWGGVAAFLIFFVTVLPMIVFVREDNWRRLKIYWKAMLVALSGYVVIGALLLGVWAAVNSEQNERKCLEKIEYRGSVYQLEGANKYFKTNGEAMEYCLKVL